MPSTLPHAIRFRVLGCLWLSAAICWQQAAAQPTPLPGRNLATGRTATFSLAPNYSYSAGGDDTDLFDGKYVREGFWTNRGTVGWVFGRKPGVLISLDLGAVASVDAVSFDTAGGSAQVTFPASVFVYVSDDGVVWHYATDLVNEPKSQARYVRHRFVADRLQTRGRYVSLYVAKGGFFAFVDEIEVIAGEHDAEAVRFATSGIETSQVEADALKRAESSIQKNITLHLIQAARRAVRPETGAAEAATRSLDAVQRAAIDSAASESVDYSRGIPFGRRDDEVCRAMGSYFASQKRLPVTIWQPAESIWSHTTSPFARGEEAGVSRLGADMMIGEYEPIGFNVSNNTDAPVTLQVQLSDLKSSSGVTWPADQIAPRATQHVVASGFLFFDDALPPLPDGGLELAPGTTRQLWLMLHSRGVTAGDYQATVTLQGGASEFEIPLSVTVYPVEMPANPTYRAQSWGYFTWPAAVGHERRAAAELQRCYANAHVLHHHYIPWPQVDNKTKKMVRPLALETARLDAMLALRPYVRQWLLWTGFEFGYLGLNYYQATDMPQVGTLEHQALFKEWVGKVRDHLQTRGLTTDRWAFYWMDEPGDDAFVKTIVPASRMAKQVDPSILIWEDHQVSLKLLEAHPEAIDIHCCPLDYYLSHGDILQHARAEKWPSVHYQAAGSKAGDPHTYYRLHHMAAVELGLDGAGLWVWADDGGQFNDYQGAHPSYAMVYATPQGPLTGKRREAWREGIEDVELWRHLKEAGERRQDAQLLKLYRESPAALTRREGPTHTGTHADLMRTRLEILKLISDNANP